MSCINYDIVISGAGFVGRILSYALSQLGYNILILDKNSILEDKVDSRNLTLSLTSSKIFNQIGLWSELKEKVNEIKNIFTYDDNSDLFLNFDHKKVSDEPLGYILKGTDLYSVLKKVMLEKKDKISIMENSGYKDILFDGRLVKIIMNDDTVVIANLFICSEGKNSVLGEKFNIKKKEYKYKHYSLICDLKLKNNQFSTTAHEIFLKSGPIAVLPYKKLMGLIFTADYKTIKYFMESSNDKLIDYLNKKMKMNFDDIVGEKYLYPIKLTFTLKYFYKKVLFMGDVIHGIHPVAGQG